MRPPVGLVEPGQQLDQRGLAGAVQADEGEQLARPDVQVEPVEHEPLAARVAEA